MKYDFDSLRELIVLQDRQVIVLDKIPGMPSVPDSSKDISALGLANAYFKQQLFPINRLDRPSGGLFLIARTPSAARSLSAQMKKKQIKKKYLAVVSGKLSNSEGILENWLMRVPEIKKSLVVSEGQPGAQQARLTFTVCQEIERYSLLIIELITGRFHQIRAQLSHAGHPIYGDVKYGFRRGTPDRAIALYSHSISFEHPSKKDLVVCKSIPSFGKMWSLFNLEALTT